MEKLAILLGDNRPDLIKEETLADIFRESAKKIPNKIALVFNDEQITYQQLDNWSDAVALYLHDQGIGAGSFVGLWHPRSLQLHVAILGIVKAGATYVPIDIEMPQDRVETVLQDVGAVACFTKNNLDIVCKKLEVEAIPTQAISLPNIARASTDYAYILYTSGSTGKPKGIPILQRQICNLVRTENVVIGIKSTDNVYQGFSVSFDMWCEETWISYYAGATIFVADATTAKAIDELSDFLNLHKITVLHAVPSLLAIIEDTVPTLRIVNAGGEACTQLVLEKWSKPNIVFYNSYGPTETTVTSSMIALKPTDKITIGYPLPNYNYAILDKDYNIVPFGHLGELVITGVCVGNGYINLPELTAEKFIKKPAALTILPGETIYRTGDEALIYEDGSVEFHGRIDDQIKLRGYRIELGEIENQMSNLENINAAAVTLKKDSTNQDQLVGYVLCKNKAIFNQSTIQQELLKKLAPYMIPQIIICMDEMPRLPSGKINRKQLPTPESYLVKNTEKVDLNLGDKTSVSGKIFTVLQHIFPDKKIDKNTDFFTDLNGHSLLAATFVSTLRKEAKMTKVSLKDVYLNRPLSKLITAWDVAPEKEAKLRKPYLVTPWWRYATCGFAQAISLVFIYGLFAAQIFMAYLGYYYVVSNTDSTIKGLLASILLFCFLTPLLSIFSIITKWLFIGKFKEGEYPLWGWYYFRWWLVEKVEGLVQINFLNGTPLYANYLRARGLKIGKQAQISALSVTAEDLIEIGDDVSLSSGVLFNNVVVEDGLIKFSKIKVGNHAYLGSNAVVEGNTVIEDWGELQDMSLLQSGKTIGVGEVWSGSPAVKTHTKSTAEYVYPLETSLLKRRVYYWGFTILLLVFPFALLTPLIPVLYMVTQLDNDADAYDFSYFKYVPALALLYIVLFALITIVLTRLLQRNIKTGTYPIYSKTYVRKWLADQLVSLSLIVMHPLFASVYISTFFRGLGAKIGKQTEISTANNVSHAFLEIGENSFIADNVTLGETDVRGQQLILERTKIGSNSFVGNSGLIPQGYELGSNMLIGVLSVPPTTEQLQKDDTKDWFGSPAIALPKRQSSGTYDEKLLFKPTKLKIFFRGFIELIRVVIPETVLLSTSILFVAYVHDVLTQESFGMFLLKFPFYFIGFIGFPCYIFTVLLKWIFIGVYKEKQMPMWSLSVWISEAITCTYESLAIPFFLDFLRGTPFLPFFLRGMGIKIGKKVWLDTTDFTEHDMTSIGDEAALNIDCGPQTHLFEDRVMKIGKINIGSRTSIGAMTIVLYDTEIGSGVKIKPLSLVMKGERIQSNTTWGGSPIKNE